MTKIHFNSSIKTQPRYFEENDSLTTRTTSYNAAVIYKSEPKTRKQIERIKENMVKNNYVCETSKFYEHWIARPF